MNSFAQKTLIAAAVAAALGTTNAYALDPTATAAATPFYSGGASAGINAAYWAATQFLVPSTIDVYTDGSGSTRHPNSLNYLIISGTTVASAPAGAPAGFPTSTNIVEMYRYSGGSFPNGATPLVAGTTLPYPTLAALGAATPITHSGQPTTINPSYLYTPANTNNQVPDWGLTDEEPPLYNFYANLNNLNGGSPVSLANITVQPSYDTPFGVGVTATVYSQKTSFTRAEIAGILTQKISDWGQLYGDSGSAMTAGPIWILDRGSGSGTKAAGNQYFLNYPGSNASGGGITPHSAQAGGGTNVNTYTGTVLNTAATGWQDIKEASNTAIVDDLLAANAASQRAIAPSLGLEFPPALEQNVTGTNDYFFAKIDGVGPDTGTSGDNINATSTSSKTKYTNVITGAYDFWYQTSFNISSTPLSSPAHLSLTAVVGQNFLAENISGAHAEVQFPASVQGVLLDPNTTKTTNKGNLWVTRKGISPAPLQPVIKATTPYTFGADPL